MKMYEETNTMLKYALICLYNEILVNFTLFLGNGDNAHCMLVGECKI